MTGLRERPPDTPARCDQFAAVLKDAAYMDGTPLAVALWHAAEGLAQLSRLGNGAAVEAILARAADALGEEVP
jgi:hypothetical protein